MAKHESVGRGMGVKNISDLVLKEIHGVCETKNLTKEQINECKMTEREIYEKFSNLSKDELNTKSNKNIYFRNNVMTTVVKRWKEKRHKSNRWIKKKINGSRS